MLASERAIKPATVTHRVAAGGGTSWGSWSAWNGTDRYVGHAKEAEVRDGVAAQNTYRHLIYRQTEYTRLLLVIVVPRRGGITFIRGAMQNEKSKKGFSSLLNFHIQYRIVNCC